MTTQGHVTSPEVSHHHSPVGFVQPRHHDKGSYVQRWKVLRERNKNLPKIEFGVKSHYVPKRQTRNAAGLTLARSLTLESMKLPSIASSVITTTGASSIKSTGSGGKKKALSIQMLIHYHRGKCVAGIWDGAEGVKLEKPKGDLNAALSKSLPNIANAVQQEGKPNNSKHRYEKISQSKKISDRKQEVNLQKEKEEQQLEQSGK